MPTLLETRGSLAATVYICWLYSATQNIRFTYAQVLNQWNDLILYKMILLNIHQWKVFWSWLEWSNKNVLQLVRDITIRLLEPELLTAHHHPDTKLLK